MERERLERFKEKMERTRAILAAFTAGPEGADVLDFPIKTIIGLEIKPDKPIVTDFMEKNQRIQDTIARVNKALEELRKKMEEIKNGK